MNGRSAAHQPRSSLRYQPGLDGIRGLAVAAVLVYHGGFVFAQGGFLGVSIFFTLSGFLITSLLVGELDEHGSISLGGFWGRRFRRLLPASWLTVALVLVAAAFGPPGQVATLVLPADISWGEGGEPAASCATKRFDGVMCCANRCQGGSGGETDDVLGGRCAAVMVSGKRCPNNAIPGSRFCDLPAHQALGQAVANLPA